MVETKGAEESPRKNAVDVEGAGGTARKQEVALAVSSEGGNFLDGGEVEEGLFFGKNEERVNGLVLGVGQNEAERVYEQQAVRMN